MPDALTHYYVSIVGYVINAACAVTFAVNTELNIYAGMREKRRFVYALQIIQIDQEQRIMQQFILGY